MKNEEASFGAHGRVLGAPGCVLVAHGRVLGAHGHVLRAHGRVVLSEFILYIHSEIKRDF